MSITLYAAAMIAALAAIILMREEYFRLGGGVIAIGMGIGGKLIALLQREELKIPIKWISQEGIDWELNVTIEHYSGIDEKMDVGDFFIAENDEIWVWDGELKRLRGKNKEEALTRFFESKFVEYIDFEKDVSYCPFEDRVFSQWYISAKE